MTDTKEIHKASHIKKVAAVLLLVFSMWMAAVPVMAEESILPDGKAVYNILLIGSDHRDDSWNGNSDVMILATLNSETGKLVLTSFMRDLYAEIPGYGTHKLNYAYAAGGAGTLVETLEDNYDLDIDSYAVVDFDSMADIVDTVGGVDMTISDAECEVLNGYLNSMNAQEDYLPGGGSYHLNGNQAVAYMRIRYVGNNDYQRTQRQRDVMKEIFSGMQNLSASDLTALAETLLTKIDHNVGPMQMVKLISSVKDLVGYELVENRIPYDDLYYSQNEMLVPDFEQTIARLHQTLYE